ncbi:MAG TPA: ABC transporter permease [Firmicutes bacterium]|nr:ABC transporter permease [Bacillota bacterium]
MNIIQRLTLRHMHLNKRRTLVTILGIIISVAMITAVSSLTVSFLDMARRDTLARTGNWQVKLLELTPEQAEKAAQDDRVEQIGLRYTQGYAQIPDPQRKNKPFLYVEELTDSGFSILPMELEQGRMPQAPGEIIVQQEFFDDNPQYQVGDVVTFSQGKRVAMEHGQPRPEFELSQNYRFDAAEETFLPERQTQWTIVGSFHQNGLYDFSPAYAAYGQMQPSRAPLTAQVALKKVDAAVFDVGRELADSLGLSQDQLLFNTELLRYMGLVDDGATMTTLYMLVAVIIAIIVIGSVSLIYNAFAISLSERSRYLGMLSSVGATKAQKRSSVFFEGAVLGAIAIPIGMVCGLVGIGITFHFISPMMQQSFSLQVPLRLAVSVPSLLMAVVISALTIFISAWLPAHQASRITAIEAIRQTGDIKLKQRTVRTSPFTRKIFGFTAELGLKNLKRNQGRYRATVFSLVISVVLFLMAASFSTYLRNAYHMTLQGIDYDVNVYGGVQDETGAEQAQQMFRQIQEEGQADSGRSSLLKEDGAIRTEGLLTPEAQAQVEASPLYQNRREEDIAAQPALVGLDEKSFAAYLESQGLREEQVPQGQAILVNTLTLRTGYQMETYQIFQVEAGDSLDWYAEQFDDEGEHLGQIQAEIPVAALAEEFPKGMPSYVEDPLLTVLVMRRQDLLDFAQQNGAFPLRAELYFNSDEDQQLTRQLEQVTSQYSREDLSFFVTNVAEMRRAVESMTIIIQVFTYGFVTLLALISVANIFNTISTSIALRKREFAMLKSVGMTPTGFDRMMKYESIFYGLKALLYGLPISFGVMYLLYQIMARNFSFGFFVPWGSVLVAVLAVYAVVGITMLYGSAKIRRQNIIEGLRQENI